MTIDRKELIELYKTTLEELRHHDTINTQAFIGLGIIIPVFLAAIGILLGSDSPLCSHHFYVKVGIFVLALLLAVFFGLITWRLNKRFEACTKVLTNIESELRVDKRMGGTSELEGLLIRRELNEIGIEKCLGKKMFRISRLFRIYIVVALIFFIAFGFFLFIAIDF